VIGTHCRPPSTEDVEGGEEGCALPLGAHEGPILSHGGQPHESGLGERWIGEGDESTCEPSLSVSQYVFPARNISIPVSQTGLGFDLDQNCKVQDINNRGLKFKIYFAESLQI
jgi:hypothetical protein